MKSLNSNLILLNKTPLYLVSEETFIIEVTGDLKKIDALLSLLKGYGIKQLARTGLTAMSRGI